MNYLWHIREVARYFDDDARYHRVEMTYSVVLPDSITPVDIYTIARPEKINITTRTSYGLEISSFIRIHEAFSFIEKHEYGCDEVEYSIYAYNERTEDRIKLTRTIEKIVQYDDPPHIKGEQK